MRLISMLALLLAYIPAWSNEGPYSGEAKVMEDGGGYYIYSWKYSGADWKIDFNKKPASYLYYKTQNSVVSWDKPYVEVVLQMNNTIYDGDYGMEGYGFKISVMKEGSTAREVARMHWDKTTSGRVFLSDYNYMPYNTNTANGIVRIVSQEGKITGSKHDVPTGDVKVTLRYYPSTSVIDEGLNNLVISGNYRFDGYHDTGTIYVTYKKPFTYSLTQQHKEPTYKRVGPYTLQGSFSAQNITTSSTTSDNAINYRSVKYDYDSLMVEAEQTSAVTKDFRIADPTTQHTLAYRALIGNRFKYDHMVDENYNIISSIDFGNDFYENGSSHTIKPYLTPTRLVASYNKWGTAKTTLVWEKKYPEGCEADEDGKWYIYRTPTDKDGHITDNTKRQLIAKVDINTLKYEDTTAERDKYYLYEVMFGGSTWTSSYWDFDKDFCPQLATSSCVLSTTSDITMGELSQVETDSTEEAGIKLHWTSERIEDNQLKYVIARKVGAKGQWDDNYATMSVDNNEPTYTDANALKPGEQYNYRVTVNAMDKKFSTNTLPAYTNARSKITAFTASAGLYGDKVALRCDIGGTKDDTRHIIITRRLMELSESESMTIYEENLADATVKYDDKEAKPGAIYLYSIYVQDRDSLGNYNTVAQTQKIGFCRTTGIVSGRVTYDNGTAVAGAKVNITSDSNDEASHVAQFALYTGSKSKGLAWESLGTNSFFKADKDFTLQCWINPDANIGQGNMKSEPTIVDVEGAFTLNLVPDSTGYCLQMIAHNGASNTFKKLFFPANRYTQLTAAYTGGLLSLTTHSDDITSTVCKDSCSLAAWTLNDSTIYRLRLAGQETPEADHMYKGYIDDIRVWTKALTADETNKNYDRLLSGNETGLKIYATLDENLDNNVFDYSMTSGVANENTPVVDMSMRPSENTPSTLSFYGLTDDKGNYIIRGIPYGSEGTNYIIRPSYGTHEFSPAHRTTFISSNTLTASGTDFNDVSSFSVTGTVVYAGTNIPVEGVMLKVDGVVSTKEGKVVQTDAQGKYEVAVPIGDHYISLELQNHTFVDNGRYPATGTVNFNKNMSGITFSDATTVNFAGRVAGGKVESTKPVGFRQSKNNIGQAEIVLTAGDMYYANCTWNGTRYAAATSEMPVESSTTDIASKAWRGTGEQNAHRIFIKTDPNTGEFSAMLPPLKYTVEKISIASNSDISFSDIPKQIDLTTAGAVYNDTAYIVNEQGDSVETYYKYAQKMVETYYASPIFEVMQTDTVGSAEHGAFGSKTIEVKGEKVNDIWAVDSDNKLSYRFGYPLFEQGNEYIYKLKIYDKYTNNDSGTAVDDCVPQSGAIVTISNPMSSIQSFVVKSDSAQVASGSLYKLKTNQAMLDSNGEATYKWRAGFPNTIKPYTSTINITAEVNNRPIAAPTITGIVIGDLPVGNNFVTKGPDHILTVLRDPPGSTSKTTFETDTIYTTEHTDILARTASEGVTPTLCLGTEMEVINFAIISSSEIKNSVEDKNTSSQQWSENGTKKTMTTFKNKVATSSDNTLAGRLGDVFVGYSSNYIIGDSRYVHIEKNTTTGNYVLNFGTGQVVDEQATTQFQYTQFEIEKKQIPTWERMRQNLFNRKVANKEEADAIKPEDHDIYATWLEPSDPDYGKENTYRFIPSSNETKRDSVNLMTEQIEGWKNLLALNEQDKVAAFKDNKYYVDNLSFDSGNSIEKSYTTNYSYSHSDGFQWTLGVNIAWCTGFNLGGVGWNLKTEVGGLRNEGWTDTETTSKSTTYGIVISDSSFGVDMNIDVYNSPMGWGPIFRVRGGQTKCPWQQEERTKYYEPENKDDNHVLNYGTVSIEKPKLACDERVKTDVPSGSSTSFVVKLSNESPSLSTQSYTLKVVEPSNTSGARVLIDGVPTGKQYLLSPGQTVEKIVTVDQTDKSITKFEDLKLALVSTCGAVQSVVHIPGDTISLSVYYKPTSSDVKLSMPHTTVNSVTGSKMNLTISDFDRSFKNFYGMRLQYQSPGSELWTTLKEYVINAADSTSSMQQVVPATGDISYPLDMSNYSTWPDGEYKFRTMSVALNGTEEVANYSDVITVTKDMECPKPLGLPTPKDGWLRPGDEIAVKFNEDIVNGLLTDNNVVVTGVLNNQEVEHSVGLHLNGTEHHTQAPYYLGKCDYSLEMWLKRNGAGTLMRHGNADDKFMLAVDKEGHLVVDIDGTRKVSTDTIPSNTWTFLACSFDEANGNLFSANVAYGDTEKQLFAKEPMVAYEGNSNMYLGGDIDAVVSELTLWNYVRQPEQSYEEMHKVKSTNTIGLVGYWKFDEGHGNTATDRTGRNTFNLENPDWYVDNSSMAALLDSTHYVSLPIADVSPLQKDSYALEFWVKASKDNKGQQTMLFETGSTDKPTVAAACDEEGRIHLLRSEYNDLMSTLSIYDDTWHHIALNVQRGIAAVFYIDGENVKSLGETTVPPLAADSLRFGVSKRYERDEKGNVQGFTLSKHLKGAIDEVRLWNANLTGAYLKEHRYERIDTLLANNKSNGLVAYYPFDRLEQDSYHQWNTKFSTDDYIRGDHKAMATATSEAPAIQRERQRTVLNSTFTSSEREIYITINNALREYNGTTLHFEVSGVKDKNGNISRPISWIANVDLNTLKWEKDSVFVNKSAEGTATFAVKMKNSGNLTESFTIDDLPSWMTVDIANGLLEPQKELTVNFTVLESAGVGAHEQTVYLSGNNNIAEPLLITAKVSAQRPDWQCDPTKYESNMPIIGQVYVNNRMLNSTESVLAAFIDGECRGTASPVYEATEDAYYTYLSVYGNNDDTQKTVEFRLWDASTGITYSKMKPDRTIEFYNSDLVGDFTTPVIFKNDAELEQNIALGTGWNWISTYVTPTDSIDALTASLRGSISVMKSYDAFAMWNTANVSQGAMGSLFTMMPGTMYSINMDKAATLTIYGSTPTDAESNIDLRQQWNWIGSTCASALSLDEAFVGVNPSENDQVKSQRYFAIYNNGAWRGTLKSVQPGLGYKYFNASSEDKTFRFPVKAATSGASKARANNLWAEAEGYNWFTPIDRGKYPSNMTIVAQVRNGAETVDTLQLAAFVGDECRATTRAIEGLYFLTVPGDTNNVPITFKTVVDGQVLTFANTVNYQTDAMIGSLDSPYKLELDKATAISDVTVGTLGISPHRATTHIDVTASSNIASVSIYNVAGNMCKYLTASTPSLRVSIIDLPAGHYVAKVKLANGEVLSEHFLKIK